MRSSVFCTSPSSLGVRFFGGAVSFEKSPYFRLSNDSVTSVPPPAGVSL